MNWFVNASTRAKLLAGFAFKMALVAAVLVTTCVGIDALLRRQTHLFAVDFGQLADMLKVDGNNADARLNVLMMLAVTNREELESLRQKIQDTSQENETLLRRLLGYNQADPAMREKLTEFKTIRDAFRDTRDKQIIPAILSGELEQAKTLVLGVQQERYQKMRAMTGDMVELARTDAQRGLEDAQKRGLQLLWTSLLAGAVAVLLGMAMVSYLNRLIAFPLRVLAGATERIVAGDLSGSLPDTGRKDEVGVLSQSFARMMQSMRDINQEIQQGVNVLASSASQILTATTEMATTASETASAVSETTSTVEEVKHTAEVSNQRAHQVAEVAQRAVEGSQTGRKAVEETIAGMNRVRSQMEAIADRIVRLSEQTQAIGEIIASVNDLAERSNLLAVNAAIEAAKAGEQGRGFAVVAQEVRSLATQSKQATAQVRAILGDIQKATSSAVMVTEQGTRAVEAGVLQTAQAGEAIRLLAESIEQAAQSARQITASAQQQFIGMDQVVQAMESIKQAALQNAHATRQTEGGARNLHELGQKLKQVVSRFKM